MPLGPAEMDDGEGVMLPLNCQGLSVVLLAPLPCLLGRKLQLPDFAVEVAWDYFSPAAACRASVRARGA